MTTTVQQDETVLTLGGRTFVPASRGTTTFDQDMYIMANLQSAGMDQVFDQLNTEDQLTQFAVKVLTIAYNSGKLFDVLAGVLVEQGKVWNSDDAKANAAFLKNLTDPADKEALHETMAAVIVGFFASAASSFSLSPKSSHRISVGEAFPDVIKKSPQSGKARATSENGTGSSAPSLDMIPRNSTES